MAGQSGSYKDHFYIKHLNYYGGQYGSKSKIAMEDGVDQKVGLLWRTILLKK